MVIRTRSQNFANLSHNTEHDDDDSDATYLLTPSHLCQNPSHAHHFSHHQSSYRYPVAETVVEESTGGSIVTVISNTASIRAIDSTPDIVLTNSESESGTHFDDEIPCATARSLLSINDKNNIDETTDPSVALLSSSPSFTTTEQATEQNLNNNEAGTDSIQTKHFSTNNCKHIITTMIWANLRGI